MRRFGLIGCTLVLAFTALLVLTTCGRPTARPDVPPSPPPLPDAPAAFVRR
ncbi:hypothetical protein ACNTMW_09175 [Planosporangium sp. 12N6]|uniref:hypothetical protein n=1 Tax=Planosporangium spinosum TaxID=3402278 RepID=UPI003CE8D48D